VPFSDSYAVARARFCEAASARGGTLRRVEVCRDPVHGSLSIDVAELGPLGAPVVVVSSGLHGVEGLFGSAVQLAWLERAELPKGKRIVLVHGLNPYGMAHLRRVNENNVDLNRNFLPPGRPYSGVSAGYERLASLLNPKSPHGGFELMIARALWQIARHGMSTLKQAVAGGQYEHPEGLFFGGKCLQPGPELVLEQAARWVGASEQIIWIDLHTGLGPSATYKLLVSEEDGSDAHRRLKARFGAQVQPWDASGKGVAYRVEGGLSDGLRQVFGARCTTLTCEFGTHSPLTVLRALRARNRAHHHGGDLAGAQAQIVEAFCPASRRWRQRVLERGLAVVEQAFAAQ
jgi:hypothetical protein